MGAILVGVENGRTTYIYMKDAHSTCDYFVIQTGGVLQ